MNETYASQVRKLYAQVLADGTTVYRLSKLSGVNKTALIRFQRNHTITLETLSRIAPHIGLEFSAKTTIQKGT